jgi:hypothetical protein
MQARRSLQHIACAFSLVLGVALAPQRAAALESPTSDKAAWLYNENSISRVDLLLEPASVDALTYVDAYSYVPATFTLVRGSRTYGPWPVTVKLKGRYGSWRPLFSKSGFKIKFPNPQQRIAGVAKLTLNNNVQDGSFLHQALAYELFRAMGVPASRTSFATVTVNGQEQGIYSNIETLDDVSLAKRFGDLGTQHLYEGNYGSWWGDPNDPMSGHYEVDEGSLSNRDDLAALIAVGLEGGDVWYDHFLSVTDSDEMIAFWAVERYLAHWDGYSGPVYNNYYLHSDASGRFTLLPWGTDQTFNGPGSYSPQWTNNNIFEFTGGPLFNLCIQHPVCVGRYIDALRAVREKVDEIGLPAQADTLYDLLSEEEEIASTIGIGDWPYWEKEGIKSFLAQRTIDVTAWLPAVPPPPADLAVRPRDRALMVSWSDMTLTEGTLNGFRVHYRRESGTWQYADLFDPEATRMRVADLRNGDAYRVRVSAITSNGSSAQSETLRGVVGAPAHVLDAAASRRTGGNAIRVAWSPPGYLGSARPLYEVQYRRDGESLWRSLSYDASLPTGGTHQVVIRGLSPVHEYAVRVRAKNVFGAAPWVRMTVAP